MTDSQLWGWNKQTRVLRVADLLLAERHSGNSFVGKHGGHFALRKDTLALGRMPNTSGLQLFLRRWWPGSGGASAPLQSETRNLAGVASSVSLGCPCPNRGPAPTPPAALHQGPWTPRPAPPHPRLSPTRWDLSASEASRPDWQWTSGWTYHRLFA